MLFKIFTRKVPFHEYATDYHLIPVLLERTEIPRRPTGDDQLDSISDEIWDLMRRCWDYTPHNRPTCEDIHQSMFDFTRAQSLQHPQEPIPEIIPWESVRRNPSVVIDYEHVHDILSHVSRIVIRSSRWFLSDTFPLRSDTRHSFRITPVYNSENGDNCQAVCPVFLPLLLRYHWMIIFTSSEG